MPPLSGLLLLALLGGPARAAELVVDDPSGCVDPAAVERALDEVEGTGPLILRITVLPDGGLRGVLLEWESLDSRELSIPEGDCAELPATVALATERLLARLPSNLSATPRPLQHGIGAGLGSGLDALAPQVGVWAETRSRRSPGWGLGPALTVAGQRLDSGAVYSLSTELRAHLLLRRDAWTWSLGAVGGAALGRGTGLQTNATALVPRIAARTGARFGERALAGLALELALGRPVWVVRGAGSTPGPLLSIQLELGAFSGPR